MFEIKGKILFDPINLTKKHKSQSTWKKVAIVKINDDSHLYYSWFIKKRFNLILNQPIRGTHITFINDIIDDKIYKEAYDLFNNKEITLFIDPTNIKSNKKGHWWLKVYSDDLKNIRNVMNLGDPYYGFHITIGVATHLQLEHSKYITDQCIRFNL